MRSQVSLLDRSSPNAPQSHALKSMFVVPVATAPSVANISGFMTTIAYTLWSWLNASKKIRSG